MARKLKQRKTDRNQPPASGRPAGLKLTEQEREAIAQTLNDYHRAFDDCFYRQEQRRWSALYLCGQLSNLERKTIEPMVLGLCGIRPNVVRAVQGFIGAGQWNFEQLMHRHQAKVAVSLGDPRGVVIVDGSGFPKQGQHSAGVAYQYCGALGKVANCQEGVFVVYASPQGATFLNGRLYVPKEWFDRDHRTRWQACEIPDDTRFRTEPELALDLVRDWVERAVIPVQWVLADEHFGQNPGFLDGIAARGKWSFAEVPSDTRVWLNTPPVEPPGPSLLGRPRVRARVSLDAPGAQEVREIAAPLPKSKWQRLTIQEGGTGPLVAEFAFLRVTTVRDRLPGPRVWLVLRRSLDPQAELKYYLCNAPATYAPQRLAERSGQRWPIETVLEEAKGEVGMDHYETRTWRGWHHHMAQTFLAHHVLVQVRLQLKKIARLDDRASTAVSRQHHRRRKERPRYSGCDQLSPAPQSCCLSIAPQANVTASSKTWFQTEKTKSLVVMKVSL